MFLAWPSPFDLSRFLGLTCQSPQATQPVNTSAKIMFFIMSDNEINTPGWRVYISTVAPIPSQLCFCLANESKQTISSAETNKWSMTKVYRRTGDIILYYSGYHNHSAHVSATNSAKFCDTLYPVYMQHIWATPHFSVARSEFCGKQKIPQHDIKTCDAECMGSDHNHNCHRHLQGQAVELRCRPFQQCRKLAGDFHVASADILAPSQ